MTRCPGEVTARLALDWKLISQFALDCTKMLWSLTRARSKRQGAVVCGASDAHTGKSNLKVMTPALVANMELHCRDSVNRAAVSKDVVYGM
ncbi:hypothetical protein PC120_g4875 [Phytophthora cactorum]|nr:hypothetical protein PC120_g4875 [Phytophthora cactorum]